MGWFSKKSRSTESLFVVEDYKIDKSINDLANHSSFRQVPIPRGQLSFIGERIYECPNATAFNRDWRLTIGAVQDQVYKIALSRVSNDRLDVAADLTEVIDVCRRLYGKAAEDNGTVMIWDVADGNVVVQTNAMMPHQDPYFINVFLTSSAVRAFTAAR